MSPEPAQSGTGSGLLISVGPEGLWLLVSCETESVVPSETCFWNGECPVPCVMSPLSTASCLSRPLQPVGALPYPLLPCLCPHRLRRILP